MMRISSLKGSFSWDRQDQPKTSKMAYVKVYPTGLWVTTPGILGSLEEHRPVKCEHYANNKQIATIYGQYAN